MQNVANSIREFAYINITILFILMPWGKWNITRVDQLNIGHTQTSLLFLSYGHNLLRESFILRWKVSPLGNYGIQTYCPGYARWIRFRGSKELFPRIVLFDFEIQWKEVPSEVLNRIAVVSVFELKIINVLNQENERYIIHMRLWDHFPAPKNILNIFNFSTDLIFSKNY